MLPRFARFDATEGGRGPYPDGKRSRTSRRNVMSEDAPVASYRLPAEWEPHRATWIGWPHNPDDWPGKFDCIPWAYVEIVRRLARSERVCVVALPEVESSARELLGKAGVDLG